MGTVHVIFQKEMVDPELMEGHIAVVIDVLLATTTIAAALEYGAKEVVPVRDSIHGLEAARILPDNSFILAGELEGRIIDGFLPPWPTSLKNHVEGKTLILSTSNGTVAINKAMKAKKIYTSSMVNGAHVASHIKRIDRGEDIIVVCSGSDGSFSMEDFLGAGYFLDSLIGENSEDYMMTDAAKTALLFYRKHAENYDGFLYESVVGKELEEYGLGNEVQFASELNVFSVVPQFFGNKLIDIEHKT
ncbi:2-phosphosulfolactate phosphatase [Bacillus sp. V33-4]|uniref:2-phosphosulfolactate phosphatase n=1 Tax=Bacillus sp. V33-4 TaxID=2054169 RepID=UPI000C76617E|nr:2-phosphosulfolactate phosphatase [Bacillus sp. V33-4]PLR80614.1 2-phosphosulfolactate phosphatase [Bacillus sp. V33-4]